MTATGEWWARNLSITPVPLEYSIEWLTCASLVIAANFFALAAGHDQVWEYVVE